MNRLLFVVNEPSTFVSHRLPIALAARGAGYEVHVATRAGAAVEKIKESGLFYHEIPLNRRGGNPFEELHTLAVLVGLMRKLRPSLVHLITIKPVLYGGIAARLCGVTSVVAAVTGLGPAFTARGGLAALRRAIVVFLYRRAFVHPKFRAIFQNSADFDTINGYVHMAPDDVVMIPGSGVDLSKYPETPEPAGIPTVVLASRLVQDKGIDIFVDAARILKERGVEVRCQVAGETDGPGSIDEAVLERWREEKCVEFLGFRSDIPDLFAGANIVTLPSSYGEGLPKVLLEAAAAGRAIVTTDHPGCRDAIIPDETGLLVPVRDPQALASAISELVENPARRIEMGQAARKLAHERFGVDRVVNTHLDIYNTLTD